MTSSSFSAAARGRPTGCRLVASTCLTIAAALLFLGCATTDIEHPRTRQVFETDGDAGLLTVRFFYLEHDGRSGDAILVKSPTGETMLIDAGVVATSDRLLDHLRRLGVNHMDYAVATHPHHDHIGGYIALLPEIPAGELLTINVPHVTATYAAFIDAVARSRVAVTHLEDGDSFSLGEDVLIQVLNPPVGTGPQTPGATVDAAVMNDLSLVLRLTHGEVSFLFTGDLYVKGERKLIARHPMEVDVEVLQVPHHGHGTSSDPAFIRAVSPDYAVVTRNTFRMRWMYRRYQRLGSRVFATGIDGTVLLRSDGTRIEIVPERHRRTALTR